MKKLTQSRIDALKAAVDLGVGELTVLEQQIHKHEESRKILVQRIEDATLAKEVVLFVAQKTQLNIGQRISDLVTLALDSVFDDPYTFEVEFVQRRGVTEADLWFVRDGNKLNPLLSSGGGPIDLASFALRLAVWSLAKSAPVFVLDEPFRNLSADKHADAGILLQTLSRKLGIQIIMVSHNPEIIAGADRVFRLSKDGLAMEGA